MSQVKKFLNGSVIKAEEGNKSPEPQRTYGHIWVDGIDYGNSEDVYNAFAQHARNQGLNQGEFYDQWLTALRNGQDVVFGNGNTVNMKPEDMSDRRAGKRSGWTKFWDDTFDTRRNHFSDAVATARRFTFTPEEKKPEVPKAKDKFDTSTIVLNYNPDPKDNKKQHWSTTHTNNTLAQKRVADALAWMTNPEQFNYENNDRISAAYTTAKGNDGAGDPNAFAGNIWNVMRNYQGLDFKDPDVQNALDWLEAFGIDVDRSTVPAGNSGGSGGGITDTKEFKGPDGKIYISDKDGNLTLKAGPTVEQEVPTVDSAIKIDNANPTLITRKFALANGLSNDYLYGLYYNGKPYSIADINNNPGLKSVMDEVERINKRTNLTQQERIKDLSERINIPYENFSTYGEWDPAYTVDGLNLGEELENRGVTSAAISEYTPTADGDRIFKYYNNAEAGNNPWGFRSPYYLVYDKDGNLRVISDEQATSLFTNKGVGNLTKPTFIKNLLGKKSLSYITPSTAGPLLSSSYSYSTGMFFIRGEKGNTQLVQDDSGKYYIYNKTSKRLTEISKEKASKFQTGGKIDFNKVNAFARGGRVARMWQGGPFDYSDVDDYLTKHNGAVNPQLLDLLKKYNIDPEDFLNWARETGYKFWDAVDENEMLDDIEEYSKARSLPFDRANPPSKLNIPEVTVPGVKLNDFNFTVPYDDSEITSFANDFFYNDVYNPLVKSLAPSGSGQTTVTDSPASNASQVQTPTTKKGLSVLDEALLNTINASKNGVFTSSNVFQSRSGNDPMSTSSWYGTHIDPFNPTGTTKSEQLTTAYNNLFGKPGINFNSQTDDDQAKDDKDFGDPNYDSSSAWTSFIKGGLSALDYGSMAWGRHKVHDQIAQGLKDSLYKRVTPRLQGVSTATPVEDAAVARADQYISRGLTTPLTSNALTNNLSTLTLQANGLQARDQAVRQQSAAALQRQMQNQQIANQQNSIDADAENDFRARLSGLRMNLAQNDASLTAQTAQSIQNLAREWRTKFNEQTAKYNQLQYNAAVSNQTELSDNTWKNYLRTNHSDAWNTWNDMPTTDRNKYGNDITTWIQQSDYWNNALENEYLKNRKTLNQKILGAYKDYNLSPELSWLYRDRHGVPGKKSGGSLTVKQRNRYKNEPWEDIWINQNKATHKLVAKLNDNVIKTFLKTLK